jgi:DnaJ-class molecular chaperone
MNKKISGVEGAMIKRDYYLILSVPRNVSNEGIKEAFRKLVKRYHPDIAGPRSRWEFHEIIEAYEVLSYPSSRRSYDLGLAHAEEREWVVPEPIVTGSSRYGQTLVPEPVSMMKDFLSISRPLDVLFDRIFRNFTHMGVPKAERPESLTLEIILNPEEAMTGGRVPINIPVLYPCPECKGSDRIWSSACSRCLGKGMVEEEETIDLNIPAKVRSGSIFEISLGGLGIHNFYLRVLIRISNYA